MSEQYNNHLNSERWQNLSAHCKAKASRKCEMCGSSERLHAHHLRYDNLGKPDELNDLCCLCYLCHAMYHSVVKIPEGRMLARQYMMDMLHDVLVGLKMDVSYYAKRTNKASRRKAIAAKQAQPKGNQPKKKKKKWRKRAPKKDT
jgi:hypothetical protein